MNGERTNESTYALRKSLSEIDTRTFCGVQCRMQCSMRQCRYLNVMYMAKAEAFQQTPYTEQALAMTMAPLHVQSRNTNAQRHATWTGEHVRASGVPIVC